MKNRYIIYCEKMDTESLIQLTEQLKEGVDVEYSTVSSSNDLIMLSVTGRKKKGRPKEKQISMEEVFKRRSAGISVRQIAEEFNCSERYLYQLIKLEKEKFKTYGI